MAEQLTLDNPTLNALEAKYREWRQGHEAVYLLFRRFAEQMRERGRRFGVKALAERVRWEIRSTWAPDDAGFKLNNNYTAYIARDLIRDDPRLDELIETRQVAGEDE